MGVDGACSCLCGPRSDQRNQTPRQTRRAFSVQSATQSTITDRRRVAADNALRTPASIQHPLGPSTRNASLDKGEHCSLTLHPLPLPMGEVAAVRLPERALSVSFADSSPKGGAKRASSDKDQFILPENDTEHAQWCNDTHRLAHELSAATRRLSVIVDCVALWTENARLVCLGV